MTIALRNDSWQSVGGDRQLAFLFGPMEKFRPVPDQCVQSAAIIPESAGRVELSQRYAGFQINIRTAAYERKGWRVFVEFGGEIDGISLLRPVGGGQQEGQEGEQRESLHAMNRTPVAAFRQPLFGAY